ncbi:MAG: flagellar basal body-associated FliL family protein [Magnetospirillum sp. WYHS-4]
MAEDDQDEDVGSGEGGDEGGKGGKKKLIILIGVALLVVIGGVATAYFTGLLDPLVKMISGAEDAGGEKAKEATPQTGEAVFMDIEEILVNLNTGGGRKPTFLKIKVALELADKKDEPKVVQLMPRVRDNFQVYLRELRVEDLKGSAGMYRLREELLTRVNVAIAPAEVKDILFKEMLVQ